MSNHYRSQKGAFHHSFLLKDEYEEKRHRSRCIYFDASNKYCSYYCMNCKGSNTCERYEEKPNVKKNISEEKKVTKISILPTIEEQSITVGNKLETKRNRSQDDIRKEIMNFTLKNRK